MFPKLALLIVCIGLCACVMLGIRQQRIQAAHELGQLQRKVVEHDRVLWRLRLEIASRTTPDRVEACARKYGLLDAVNPGRYTELVRREAEEAARTAVTVNDPQNPSGR